MKKAWGQFKNQISHICLAGSLTQKVADLNSFIVMANIFIVAEFTNQSEVSAVPAFPLYLDLFLFLLFLVN